MPEESTDDDFTGGDDGADMSTAEEQGNTETDDVDTSNESGPY